MYLRYTQIWPINVIATVAIFTFATCITAIPANAQQRIGAATSVSNTVIRVHAGGTSNLEPGFSVYRNETVRTGQRSAAKLVFLDETNLAIGPESSVVLDNFVFSSSTSTQALSVNLARGVFRFSTGILDKRAYKLNTSVATIGVRGTLLDIGSGPNWTRVTLVDNGAALVCTRAARPRCVELNSPRQSVNIRGNSIARVRTVRQTFSFRPYCERHQELCSITRIADAVPLPADPTRFGVRGGANFGHFVGGGSLLGLGTILNGFSKNTKPRYMSP
jgi:hypothetical protein